jgi:hypothetical protein
MPRRASLLAIAATATAIGVLAALAVPATASTPTSSGTVTPPASGQSATYTWTGTLPGGANPNSDCSQSVSDTLNDHHTVTLSVPSGFYTSHKLIATFTITPTVDDAILTLEQGAAVLGSSDNGGNGAPESFILTKPVSATYDAVACTYTGVPEGYTGTLTLQTDPTGALAGGTATNLTPASYQNYVAPAGLGDSAGEPSIGVDWKTNAANGGTTMFQSDTQALKVAFDGTGSGANAAWNDVSAPNAVTSLDPILYTDSVNGRTFTSQLTGVDSLSAYTDDDGATWTPSQGGGIPSGVDHQSLGAGPYPAGSLVHSLVSYPNAVYYCSQDIAAAFCARSDHGGLTFGAGVPIYNLTQCGGLHGHVKVSPDGTVYVPNKSCGGQQGVAVSSDAGLTWTVHAIANSTPGNTDPSIGVGSNNTVYEGFVNGDGLPEITASSNHGATFSQPVNVGAVLGIKNAVFPEVVAGDGNRAAFAFLGTTTPGDSGASTFGQSADGTTYTGGEWHLYIATTADGGQTWQTVDATPTDPVQRGSICTAGTTCGADRNLLDFNDITIDKYGHVEVAYADGCTGACVTSTKVADNTHTAKATIARQYAGTGLLAAYDPTAPVTTKGHGKKKK